jgi:hypothetical protein
MITHPTAAELARAVAQWIDEVRPKLDQRNAYLARVAINALAVIDRELSQSAVAKTDVTERLSKLLNRSGDYDELMRELCERLRSGGMNIETPDLLATLRADTLAKLAVDQPNYRHEKSQ